MVELCYNILTHLKTALNIANDEGDTPYSLLSSNRLACINSMEFGWVLSMLNRTNHAHYSGPALGHKFPGNDPFLVPSKNIICWRRISVVLKLKLA
jgi:hypothetical protein